MFMIACMRERTALGDSRETPWLVVSVGDAATADAAADTVLALESAFVNAGERVLLNAEAARRFEEQAPTAAQADAEKERTLLRALKAGRRELALGHLEKAREELAPIEALQSDELDMLRRSQAKLLFQVCVHRGYLLQRDGKDLAAREALSRCVATYPGLTPHDQPEIRSLFDATKSAMSFQPLSVQGPAGCTVRLFGVEVGRAPLTLSVAIGLTPVQLECTNQPGRRHLVDVGSGSNSVEIDPRFDRVVATNAGLRLAYADARAQRANVSGDAAALGDMLGALVLRVEREDTASGLAFRVSALDRTLGEIHDDAHSGDVGVYARRIADHVRDEKRETGQKLRTNTDRSGAAESNDQVVSQPVAAPSSASLVQPVLGAALGVVGLGGLITSWALYAERQDFRLTARPLITGEVLQDFDSRGAWMLGAASGGVAGLVAAEYLLLPASNSTVPTAAWLVGAAGVGGAAVGLAYTISSDSCEPMSMAIGDRTSRACFSRTADGLFGPMLILSSLPLLNVPLVYLLRGWLGSSANAVSLTPSSIAVRGTF